MRIFELEPPPRYRLENPPLALAVVQLNFPILGRLQTLEGVTPLQDALTATFPYMQVVQVDQLEVVLGPGQSAFAPPQRSVGWRLTDDAGWVLNINPATAHLAIG